MGVMCLDSTPSCCVTTRIVKVVFQWVERVGPQSVGSHSHVRKSARLHPPNTSPNVAEHDSTHPTLLIENQPKPWELTATFRCTQRERENKRERKRKKDKERHCERESARERRSARPQRGHDALFACELFHMRSAINLSTRLSKRVSFGPDSGVLRDPICATKGPEVDCVRYLDF